MKRFLQAIFIFLSASAFSQNLIDNQWLFKTGDSLIWKEKSYSAQNWNQIKAGIEWEKQGFSGYNGFAWYRKSVVIPSRLKNEVIKYGGLSLYLGAIDDNDQTFFNGKLVGESGQMQPNFSTAYDKKRRYDISVRDILWDQENVIAVRVYDNGGEGGLLDSNTALNVGQIGSNIKVKPQFPAENHIFLNGKNVSYNLNIENKSAFLFNGTICCVLVNDFKDTISVSTEKIKLQPNQNKTIWFKNRTYVPGFYTMYVQMKSALLNTAEECNFGVEPENIVSETDRAADFENFWMRAKRELAAVDPQYKLIHIDSLSTSKRDVYLVEMRSLENVLIRGWYARPKVSGKFPAILHVQGYSSNAQMNWGYSQDDMAVFVLNIRGHGNSKDNINPGFPGYLLYNLKDRERYIYRGAYMDCIRAVDFLCSRKEVDSCCLVVEGGSQGGALSFATAALDNQRVKLCMPSVPFLSDFRDYFKIAGWPGGEFIEFERKNQDFGWEKIYSTLSYFDIKNLAPWVRCPVLMTIGLKDVVCPPHINFAAYNQLNVPKSYVVFPYAGHGLPGENLTIKYQWMKTELEKLKKTNK